jgi:phosphatidylglycerophosphate synthase
MTPDRVPRDTDELCDSATGLTELCAARPHPPLGWALVVALMWGLLLGTLTRLVARRRGANVARELWKHLATTLTVLTVSRIVGILILSRI